MNKLDSILNTFKAKDGFDCFGSVDSETINQMERELNITFPSSYRYFLEKLGYMEWFGFSIFGYSEDEYNQVVRNTQLERERFIPDDFDRISNKGCILEYYGGGGYYFLFSEESERCGQVALFLSELFGKEADSWGSFEEFLEYMAQF